MTAPIIDQRVVRFWTLFGTTLLAYHPGAFYLCINAKGWDGIKEAMRDHIGAILPDGTTSAEDVMALHTALHRIIGQPGALITDALRERVEKMRKG